MSYRTVLVPRRPTDETIMSDDALAGIKDQLLEQGTVTIHDAEGNRHAAKVVEAEVTDRGVEVAFQLDIPFDGALAKKMRQQSMSANFTKTYGKGD